MEIPPKLRIMCSYGGHIVPRPRTKSLCYAGGDTRIVSLNPTSAASLSALVSHIGSSLSIPSPFALKYQLPNHDLDSLISLLTDDDLLILLEELQRLSSSSGSSRIRLFVFPAKAAAVEDEERPSSAAVMQHPKTESWFFDTLKSAEIMQKGRNCGGGLGFEGEGNGNGGGGEDLVGNGVGLSSVAESMVLETSSSFGSTSSSASLTNLAPVKSNGDDTGIGLQDSIAKLTSSDNMSSEYGGSTVTSCPQIDAYRDSSNPVLVPTTDNKVYASPHELDAKGSGVSSGIQAHSTVMTSPYQLDPNLVHHQKVQYIHVESPYVTQSPQGYMPISSFYPLYHTQLPQQQMVQLQYQPNQPHPVYLMPVQQQTQTYSFPRYPGFIENPSVTSGQTPVHSYINTHGFQNEPVKSDVAPNLASQVYSTAQIPQVPYTESQQQQLGLYEKAQLVQPGVVAYREPPKDSNEFHDDASHVQIYKSQPPPPPCLSQYQTVAKPTEVSLSEALDQLHTDSLKQQIKTSPPQ